MEYTNKSESLKKSDDTNDVTLAHKGPYYKYIQMWPMWFQHKNQSWLKMHISKQHKISQLDGENDVVDNEFCVKHAQNGVVLILEN